MKHVCLSARIIVQQSFPGISFFFVGSKYPYLFSGLILREGVLIGATKAASNEICDTFGDTINFDGVTYCGSFGDFFVWMAACWNRRVVFNC